MMPPATQEGSLAAANNGTKIGNASSSPTNEKSPDIKDTQDQHPEDEDEQQEAVILENANDAHGPATGTGSSADENSTARIKAARHLRAVQHKETQTTNPEKIRIW